MQLAADEAEKAGIDDQKVRDQLALASAGAGRRRRRNIWKRIRCRKRSCGRNTTRRSRRCRGISRATSSSGRGRAVAITKELKGGADFAKLAAKRSKDSSSKSGGDLGWFTLDTMVKPFSDAVKQMQPGQLTEQPVQSQYGWHVIKLEETRATSAPPFDEVKDRVKMIVQRKKLQSHLEELRKTAKVEKTAAVAAPAAAAKPADKSRIPGVTAPTCWKNGFVEHSSSANALIALRAS